MLSIQPECAAPASAAGNGSPSRFLDALGIGPEITGRVKLPPLSALETPIKAPASGPYAFFELAAQNDDLPETPLAGDFPSLESLTVPVLPAVPVLVPVPMSKPAPIATLVPKAPVPAPASKAPLEPIIAEPVKETPPPAAPLPASIVAPEPVKPAASAPLSAPVAPVAAPAPAPAPVVNELLYLGCPVCKSELTIGAEYVGVQGACPSCQTPIVAYRESDTVVRLMVLTAKPPMPTAPRAQASAGAPKR